MELSILITEVSKGPLSGAHRECDIIFICVSDFKGAPSLGKTITL